MSRDDLQADAGRRWWRSLQELAGSEESRRFLEAEFPAEAPPDPAGPGDDGAAPGAAGDGFSRRRFLQLMSASLALAGAAGCRWPRETIVPFAQRPAGFVPGATSRYATSRQIGGLAAGLLATSFDGRPIKVDGNPAHPFSLGGSDPLAQALVLQLYDPDRSRGPARRAGGQSARPTWDDFAAFAREHFGALRGDGGRGLAILSEAVGSPGVRGLRRELLEAFPQARWYEWEPLSWDSERVGTALVFGRVLRPVPRLEEARVVVSLDCDLLADHPAALRSARRFAEGRRPDPGTMNRLYCFESTPTVTGAAADHRFPTPAREIQVAAAALAAELYLVQGLRPPLGADGLREALRPFADHALRPAAVPAIARDLTRAREQALLVAGRAQDPWVHAVCHLVNHSLRATGNTVDYVPEEGPERRSHHWAIGDLAARLRAGEVRTLLLLGGNPVYDAPADLDFAAALAQAPVSIHLSLYRDETSRACTWHLPRAHPLESWGDATAPDGSLCARQPLIEPLHGGRTAAELLDLVLRERPRSGHEIARDAFHRLTGGDGPAPAEDADFERRWRGYLRDGWLPGSAPEPVRPQVQPLRLIETLRDHGRRALRELEERDLGEDRVELVFTRDDKVLDGRFANSAWLQELPAPLTKLTWDNALLLGPATAARLGLAHQDVARIEYEGRRLEAPVFVLPGQAEGSASLAVGYGRRAAGRVGDGIGVDAYALLTSEAPFGGRLARVTPAGRRHDLASTQDHFQIDARGREETERRALALVREADLQTYREHPDFAAHAGPHHPPLVSPWVTPDYTTGHRWGMAVDLSRCTGCSACVVACQAENNVPVVGKERVLEGREMQWLRIDRYFTGDPERPRALHQPMACVHCEMAPCEGVCPVAATVHSSDGLNLMVYNRCIGTRYCSNNCPYKVRRFNFFNYAGDFTPLQEMGKNPQVTVRSRGVMEKCTYCVQRIQGATIRARRERRPLRDGEIVPACAEACPAGAIVFGDLNDPASRVAALQADRRAYFALAELNVKPRTAYLARIANPNPELAAARPGAGGHGESAAGGGGAGHGEAAAADHDDARRESR